MIDESTTKQLNEILSKINDTKSMECFMTNPKITDEYKTFIKYFRSLPQVQKLTDSDLINLSGIEKSYYYQIFKGTRNPSRDKVLRLCIGAGLSMRETTRALELSQLAPLYPKNRRDIIISVAINQHASVLDTDTLLDKYNEEPLS
ncbi:MAG: helix-turn-helix transcriptional regulator [Lachnospiraceae bacterium]|nr:helix-turn-helix transcriptional regulator [Lachnospiraceae bacterium]